MNTSNPPDMNHGDPKDIREYFKDYSDEALEQEEIVWRPYAGSSTCSAALTAMVAERKALREKKAKKAGEKIAARRHLQNTVAQIAGVVVAISAILVGLKHCSPHPQDANPANVLQPVKPELHTSQDTEQKKIDTTKKKLRRHPIPILPKPHSNTSKDST